MSTTNLSPRQYQIEASTHAINENSIINIKTGGGKTLIGVMIINHYLSQPSPKKILFIVPSRALVQQQAEYCQKHCIANNKSSPSPNKTIRIAQLCGNEMESWSKSHWNQAINNHDIFVGTLLYARIPRCDICYMDALLNITHEW